ncbi:EF-P beta-lysylation protein EpmB [Moraxella caviae]|nr:EF-P beta-lysylation protein EpmB [Moraxella caviae]OOR90929.1 EF-P beta-lysylation protein EpmB [Moraxella caviae]
MDDWQKALANAVSDVDELLGLLDLSAKDVQSFTPKRFGLRVPRAFVAKMQPKNPNDPLLLQVLPQLDETMFAAGYSTDPLAENAQNPIKGLLHKYQNRALITLTGACAVHCRYCFRQHFDYQSNMPSAQVKAEILAYLAADEKINEVLLSGGDPLNVSNRRLAQWLDELAKIKHIKTIRIHTRLPVVLPSRVDNAFLDMLKNCPKHIVMVLHINHANEIDETFAQKCQALKQAGVVLLNQTVLLKGVNDDAKTLAALSHALFDAGIMPYYLHILDKVAGAAHFDVPMAQAVAIYWQLLARVSGYLVPKLVQELPNRPYKTPVDLHKFAAD